MASFGDSFPGMAEAMLGKCKRSSSFEILTVAGESVNNPTPGLKRVRSDDTDTSTSSSNTSDRQKDRQIHTSERMEEMRSVVVVSPPKRRRRRMTANYSAVDVVYFLNRAMSKVSPRSSLAFGHNVDGRIVC